MKKQISICLLAAAVVSIVCSTSLYAWGGRTHKKITSDAYFIMPEAFRKFLGETSKEARLGELMAACVEPDTVLKDFKNHVYHIQGYDLGNGPFKVNELAKEIVNDIKRKAPISKIIQKLGWISHYVADLTQPLHTGVATWEGIEEKSYHSSFEKDVDNHIYCYGVYFDGANATDRISARIVYEALWANQYYTSIESAYTKGNRYVDTNSIAAICYSRAVNNVYDIWYSIWVAAGGKTNPKVDGKPRNYPPYQQGTKEKTPSLPRSVDTY